MRTQVMHDPAIAAPWLEGNLGGETAEKYYLESFPFKIGRNESADLCIDSTRVSREHALISRHGKQFHLHDLGSTNGTFLNGQRIQEAMLHDGDQVMVAEVEFTFNAGGPAINRETATQVMPHGQSTGDEAYWQTVLAVRRVHEAVTRRGLRVLFQPIVELGTGEAFAFEALFTDGGQQNAQPRCDHWTGGIECRASERLRKLCRRMAAEEAVQLPRGNIVVALSAVECEGLRLVDHLRQLYEAADHSRPLIVEIPENAVVDGVDFQEFRMALRHAKVEVCYDNYTAGQAEISQRPEMTPDYFKLAPSLVRGLGSAHHRLRQVQMMVEASHNAGTRVIAAGVDSEAELDICHQLKVDFVQGNLYAIPQDAAALALAQHAPQATSAAL